MQTKISKTLESIVARTAFDAAKADIRHSHKDLLMQEIMREEGSVAYRILASRLKDRELYQISLRIAGEIKKGGDKTSVASEEFYPRFLEELRDRNPEAETISTLHAMLDIAGDPATATCRILALYHIDTEVLRLEAERQPQNDDYSARIRIHIDSMNDKADSAIEMLDKFGTNLTLAAAQGKIDPVIGRENEIERVIQILSRRKKNNPILIGEAGVGKSAIVEGLALRMASGDVPYDIRRKSLYSLDVSSLVAGTKFRGEFEERMQQLLEALRKADNAIIFIDEIHTIVGAGSTQGSLDTANILKPALARGEIQVIGATTLDEYRKGIESDAALERRFQRVIIEPATCAQTLDILRNIAPHYEHHHKVRYGEGALEACVALTERYITDRFFPDKAIDVMDEAGARAHLRAAAEPEAIREMERALQECRREKKEAVEAMVYERAASARIREIALRSKIGESRRDLQREMELNPVVIEAEDIAHVVTSMTGIPVERISDSEAERLRSLDTYLMQRVIGQDEAVAKVARSIRRSRAGLKDESRPIGVFMFVGPTGVGKTLLAKELSRRLFDEHRGLIRIDMSEYGEKHNVARLIGSPPGYVGYGEGGQLTEAVRRQPYAVVLFDEIEKAHPDVFNTMLQIFDEGHLTDGSGRKVDFRHTVIIMTSNVGSRNVVAKSVRVGFSTASKEELLASTPESEYRMALEETFAPEFLNRVDEIVVFRPLETFDVERIVDLEIAALGARMQRLGYSLRVSDTARNRLARNGFHDRYGARALKRTILDEVEEPLSTMIIDGVLHAGDEVVVEQNGNGVVLKVA